MSGRTFTIQSSWHDAFKVLDLDIPQSKLRKSIAVSDSINQQIEEFINRYVVTSTSDDGSLIFDATGTYTFEGNIVVNGSATINGDVELDGTGVFKTSDSGQRIEMGDSEYTYNSDLWRRIEFYSGHASETVGQHAWIGISDETASDIALALIGAEYSGGTSTRAALYLKGQNGTYDSTIEGSAEFIDFTADLACVIGCDDLVTDISFNNSANTIDIGQATGVETTINTAYIFNSTGFNVSNNAVIFSNGGASNIDHFWHNDTDNSFIFNSDTTLKSAAGTGNVRCNSVEFSGGNADYIYHDGNSYEIYSNSSRIGSWIDAGNLYIKQHFIGERIYLGAGATFSTTAVDYINYDTGTDEFDFVFGGDLSVYKRLAEDNMAWYVGGVHWWEALESGGGISVYSDNLTSSGTSKNAVHYDNATGRVYEFTSSLRVKDNVERQNLLEGITVLPKIGHSYNVKPEFQLDPDGDDVKLYGPIAEDLARIHPSLVHYDEDGPRGPNDVVLITALWDRVAELERIVYGEEPEPYLPLPTPPPSDKIRPGPGFTRERAPEARGKVNPEPRTRPDVRPRPKV